ncbi:MAG TPA: glycosyltransferase family 39 protein [Candidatus Eisenbacteria bacterium]
MTRTHEHREDGGRPRRFDPILALILLAALVLRLWGIADRLPDPSLADSPMDDTAVDEGDRRAMLTAWDMWRGGTRPLQLNPGTGDWPGLPFYLTLGLQFAARGYDAIAHPGATSEEYARRTEARPGESFLFARVLCVPLGVLTIFLVYLLGFAVGGRGVGLTAAGLLAMTPFHVLSSQRISDPNVLSLLFVTGAALALLRVGGARGLAPSVAAGGWIGLAGASKYVPLSLAATLVFAHLAPGAGRSGGVLPDRWKRLGAGLVAVVVAFALFSPFTFLDWGSKARDMQLQRGRLLSSWVGQSESNFALLTYLTRTLPSIWTWPGYLLSVLGLVLLWRSGSRGRILASIPVVFLLAIGVLGVAEERFALPLLGVLAVAAAYAAFRLGDRIAAASPSGGRKKGSPGIAAPRPAAALTGLLLALFAAWSVAQLTAVRRAMAAPDSRHAARAWIAATIDPREPMAMDLYGPVLARGPGGRRALTWPFLASASERARLAYHPAWLDGIRYYAVSSEVTRRFERAGRSSATESAFYAWIRAHGRRIWSTDPRAASGPQIDVYELPRAISSRAARDSLWAEERGRNPSVRLTRWAAELAQDFALTGEWDRAEEWARRGLELPATESRQLLFETLTFARMERGDAEAAEATAREGLASHPRSALLHLYRAMALESLARPEEALTEYRAALPLHPDPEGQRYVRAAIARLHPAGGDGRSP